MKKIMRTKKFMAEGGMTKGEMAGKKPPSPKGKKAPLFGKKKPCG